jgi:hypothetical protein
LLSLSAPPSWPAQACRRGPKVPYMTLAGTWSTWRPRTSGQVSRWRQDSSTSGRISVISRS